MRTELLRSRFLSSPFLAWRPTSSSTRWSPTRAPRPRPRSTPTAAS